MACSYLSFSIHKIHQNTKKGGFCEELLSENDSEAVLNNFCCYEYGANTEEVQKVRTRTLLLLLELCQFTLKQLILKRHLWKNTFSSLLPACWRYKPGFSFFPNKMSNLLHVGLILIIGKVFTMLCLLCLCKNREYPGNFENKTVISNLFFKMCAQVKWERRPFWSGQEAEIYPLNYLLPTYKGNIYYYSSVDHPIPTLPVETGSTLAIFKINQ